MEISGALIISSVFIVLLEFAIEPLNLGLERLPTDNPLRWSRRTRQCYRMKASHEESQETSARGKRAETRSGPRIRRPPKSSGGVQRGR